MGRHYALSVTRPSPLVGHAVQIHQLEQDLQSGNLSHAYLFVGPPRIGKFTVAKWFAKRIMTHSSTLEYSSTRVLGPEAIERQIDQLIHPDVLVLDKLWMEEVSDDWNVIAKYSNIPQQHRAKAKVKTDIIGIDDVRMIQERLYETGMSSHRICLIRSVERMRDEAANAFLKTIEEPPPGRVFILTAESASSVIPTIASRCRIVRFQRVGDREIAQMLTDLDPVDAHFIVRIAQGAPGLAKKLHDDPDALRIEQQVHDHARSVWTARTLADRLGQLKPLFERGPEAESFLRHLSLTLRDLPGGERSQERALMQLVRDLETNAHRQLLVQRFALELEP
jgi:DNA polymerase III subunit delta'